MRCHAGEDAKLKQMLWVVENLQEELFRAQEYRLQAEKRQQQHRATITSLQVCFFSWQSSLLLLLQFFFSFSTSSGSVHFSTSLAVIAS